MSDDAKVRAETASGIKEVIQGRTGKEWADACLANPYITLPPGAGYLMVQHFMYCLITSAEQMVKVTGFLETEEVPDYLRKPANPRHCVFCDSPDHWTFQHARNGQIRDYSKPEQAAPSELSAGPSDRETDKDDTGRGEGTRDTIPTGLGAYDGPTGTVNG